MAICSGSRPTGIALAATLFVAVSITETALRICEAPAPFWAPASAATAVIASPASRSIVRIRRRRLTAAKAIEAAVLRRGRPYCGAPLYDASQHLIGDGARARSLPDWPDARPLRSWQEEASEAVRAHSGTSFLASATPASGKTTFGLHIAHRMLSAGFVSRVVVAGPTTHICRQWAADAGRYGIDLEPNRPNSDGPEPRDRHGVAVTYATLAAGPGVHRRRCAELPTLLIADEPHHMGELASWGRSTRDAFAGARFRLLLSGTPFRSDNTPIPWVSYDDNGVSSADYAYGYTEALIDGVCRPVTFHTYDGDMEWMSDGRLRRADFEVVLPAVEAARRLRTALDPEGDWVTHVLTDAHRQLVDLRAGNHPDAGGLVIAADKE